MSEMTIPRLKEVAEKHYEAIHVERCFSSQDIQTFYKAEAELNERGVHVESDEGSLRFKHIA